MLNGEPLAIVYPSRFPAPVKNASLPTQETVALGKKLFHDDALSVTGKVSCAFCHLPEEAFSDPALQPWGVQPARTTRRHSMPLFNLAWKKGPFRWDGAEESLQEQILRPITDPIELGENLETLPQKLIETGDYSERFQQAFGDAEINEKRLATAIEHYLFSLISADSRYEQAERGETVLSEQEERGKALFFNPVENSEKTEKGAGCAQCHPAPLFTDNGFHNNGLGLQRRDRGRAEVTKKAEDMSKFVTPSLRNIEVTSPYMHDARFATLEEVVAHYSGGIHPSKTLSPLLEAKGLGLSAEEQADLVAFLRTLTDPIYEEENPGEPIEVDDPFAQPKPARRQYD